MVMEVDGKQLPIEIDETSSNTKEAKDGVWYFFFPLSFSFPWPKYEDNQLLQIVRKVAEGA